MKQDQVWQAIDSQRTTVARLLESLHDSDWERPSLCAHWTVRDVAAHLTLQQVGPLDAVRMMVTAPGGMNRTIRESARRHAAKLSAAQIVAEIGGMARVWNRAGDPRHQWRSVVLADRPSGRAAVARWRRDRSPAGAARRRRPLIPPVFLTVSSRVPRSIRR